MEVLYRSNTKGNILKEYCKSLLRNPAAKPRISLHKIIQVEDLSEYEIGKVDVVVMTISKDTEWEMVMKTVKKEN